MSIEAGSRQYTPTTGWVLNKSAFAMNGSPLATRLVVPILALAAFTLPLVGIGARQAVKSNANDVRDWLPAHYAETTQFRWFTEHFGSEDFVLVSWTGCTLADER